MKFTLASLLTPTKSRQSRSDQRWTFEVDRSSAPASVSWRWARHHPGGLPEHSQKTFATFADCARDAQAHGFNAREAYALSDRPSVPSVAWAGPRSASPPAPAANAADV